MRIAALGRRIIAGCTEWPAHDESRWWHRGHSPGTVVAHASDPVWAGVDNGLISWWKTTLCQGTQLGLLAACSRPSLPGLDINMPWLGIIGHLEDAAARNSAEIRVSSPSPDNTTVSDGSGIPQRISKRSLPLRLRETTGRKGWRLYEPSLTQDGSRSRTP